MRTIYTVYRQRLGRHSECIDGFTDDYETAEEAITAAKADWEHLTTAEQRDTAIVAYEDVITVEEDEEHDEERRSWSEGYNPLIMLGPAR